MMYGRLHPGVLGGEALVSVGHHLLLLVAGPGVEDLTDVQVVGVVRPAVPGQLHHVLSLEENVWMEIRDIPSSTWKSIIS